MSRKPDGWNEEPRTAGFLAMSVLQQRTKRFTTTAELCRDLRRIKIPVTASTLSSVLFKLYAAGELVRRPGTGPRLGVGYRVLQPPRGYAIDIEQLAEHTVQYTYSNQGDYGVLEVDLDKFFGKLYFPGESDVEICSRMSFEYLLDKHRVIMKSGRYRLTPGEWLLQIANECRA